MLSQEMYKQISEITNQQEISASDYIRDAIQEKLANENTIKREELTMKIRTYHTSINLLIEPEIHQRLKMTAKLKKTSMSMIIRDGIKLKLAQIDKLIDGSINFLRKGACGL